MEPLFLVQRRFHPQPRGVGEDVFGECQCAFNVEFFESCVVKVALGERDLLIDACCLPLEGVLIDGLAVHEGVNHVVLHRAKFFEFSGQLPPRRRGVLFRLLPDVHDGFAKHREVVALGSQSLQEGDKARLEV